MYRINPNFRLAWLGKCPDPPEQLNAGKFVIIKLLPFHESGSIDEPRTFLEFWDAHCQMDTLTNTYTMVKSENGPMFDRQGNPRRDWNQDAYRAVLFGDLQTDEVMSGNVIPVLEYTLKASVETKKADKLEAARREGRKLQTKHVDARTKMAEKAKWLLSRQLHRPRFTAQKHLKLDPGYRKTMNAQLPDYTDYYAKKHGLVK